MNRRAEQWMFGLLLVSAVIPLVVVKGMAHPFLVPRELLLRVIAALLLPAVVVVGAPRVVRFARPTVLGVAAVAFLFVQVCATFFSVEPAVSFWGAVDRMGGLVTIGELAIVSAALYLVAGSPERRTWLIRAWAAGWWAVAAFAILERLIPSMWAQFNGNGGRAVATFGNPIFLAGGLVSATALLIPAILMEANRVRRLVCLGAVIFFGGWALVNTETRGMYIGVVAGGVTALLLAALWIKNRKLRIIGVTVPVVLFGTLLILWSLRGMALDRLYGIPVLPRAISIFQENDASRIQRFMLWRIGWEVTVRRPVLGWGQELFDYALDRHYPPAFTRYGVSNSYSDRVHNGLLDVGATTGFLGLATYLGLWGAVMHRVIRLRRAGTLSSTAAAAAVGGMVAHVVTLLTAFETPGSMFGLAWGVGILAALPHGVSDRRAGMSHGRSLVLLAALGAVGVSGWLLWRGVMVTAHSFWIEHRAITSTSGEVLLRAAEDMALSDNPYRPQQEHKVANEIFKSVGNQTERGEPAVPLLRQAELLLRHAVAARPNHFSTHFTLANVLLLGMTHGLHTPDEAIAALVAAQRLSPGRQMTDYQLGNYYLIQGDKDRAVEAFKRAYDADPQVPESQWHYARGLASVGRDQEAASLFIEAWEIGFGRDRPDNEFSQAINTLIETGNLDVVQSMYTVWVKLDPRHSQRFAALAAVSAQIGLREPALKALKQALALDPTLAEHVPTFLAEYGFPSDALTVPVAP